MKIAVLSGKGGTGKTLVSVNLAYVAGSCVYVDCDVEEPNGHLFFKPLWGSSEPVTVKIPFADEKLCVGCKKCVEFCRFNALALIKNRLYVFGEVCHSCGGCAFVCPHGAINEKEREIGAIQTGASGAVTVVTGIQNPGEASGVPIIKKHLEKEFNLPVFIDCPPGSACTVMESIKDADYCVLVAEPTLFGVHNLKMVCELAGLFKKPFGVVLNKCVDGENPAKTFCVENKIKVLAEIPYDAELGRLNSNGHIAARESREFGGLFSSMLCRIEREVGHEAAADS